ncbi:MAG: hypothetical protein WD651_09225 [Acidimicrobiia bacterium]
MDSTQLGEDHHPIASLAQQLVLLTDLDPADLPDPAGELAEQLAEALDSLEEERTD